MALVRHPRQSFGDPAFEGVMNCVARDLQIGGDARHAPSLAVQGEYRMAARGGVGDLVVGREAAPDEDGQWVFGEDTPHRVVARTPPELDAADLRDLMVVE